MLRAHRGSAVFLAKILAIGGLLAFCLAGRAEAQFRFLKRNQADHAPHAAKPADPPRGNQVVQGDLNSTPENDTRLMQPLDLAKKIQFQIEMGKMQETGGKVEDALTAYEKALESVKAESKKPFHRRDLPAIEASILHRMAVANDRLGRFPVAGELYEKALKLKPQDARIWNDAGYSASQQCQWQEAERKLRQALKLRPNDTRATNNLGIALAAQGKIEEAIALMSRVGGPGSAHANVGYVFASQGKISEAKAHYQKSLLMQPGLNQAEEALARLELLESPRAITHAALSGETDRMPKRVTQPDGQPGVRTTPSHMASAGIRTDTSVQQSARPLPASRLAPPRPGVNPGLTQSTEALDVIPARLPTGRDVRQPTAPRTDTAVHKSSYVSQNPDALHPAQNPSARTSRPFSQSASGPGSARTAGVGASGTGVQPIDPVPIARSHVSDSRPPDSRDSGDGPGTSVHVHDLPKSRPEQRVFRFRFPWSK